MSRDQHVNEQDGTLVEIKPISQTLETAETRTRLIDKRGQQKLGKQSIEETCVEMIE